MHRAHNKEGPNKFDPKKRKKEADESAPDAKNYIKKF
jgi:hypothetical protein